MSPEFAELLTDNEGAIRITIFAAFLSAFFIIENALPDRTKNNNLKFWTRVANNLSFSAINTVMLRLLPFLLATNAALFAEQHQIGLLNLIQAKETAPLWLILLCVAGLDLAIYWQHRLFHKIPWLWRLHRVHHSDTHLDTTSALRFHPAEIFLSMLIKTSLTLLLGLPFIAIVIFEITLNASAIFNHANIRLPRLLDNIARKIIVTPAMHRIHHSTIMSDSNSNFGFCLSCWDRIFHSYTEKSRSPSPIFELGVKGLAKEQTYGLKRMLLQPLQEQSQQNN
jgi:sterol desaturase/sphingolipid hydroxylase (fatty acid hydroxylase superfamily)